MGRMNATAPGRTGDDAKTLAYPGSTPNDSIPEAMRNPVAATEASPVEKAQIGENGAYLPATYPTRGGNMRTDR